MAARKPFVPDLPPDVAWPRFTRQWSRCLETRHQFVENPARSLPAVIAIFKLLHILLKVLRGNVDVGPADRKLEPRPEAFDAVGMNRSSDIFACAVVHRIVIETGAPQAQVGAKLVSYDCGAAGDIALDDRLQRLLTDVRHHLGHHVAAALSHAEYDRLVGLIATSLALHAPADIGFICLDDPAQRVPPSTSAMCSRIR